MSMKQLFFPILAVLLLAGACTQDQSRNAQNNLQSSLAQGLRLDMAAASTQDNIRVIPIVSEAPAPPKPMNYVPLNEAMQRKGFRVLERQNFGRQEDNWFHAVTVMNKLQDTVYIMSGDVVTGGNQDRVFAHNEVVLPGSVRNLEVYCVEADRSSYYDPSASEAEKSLGMFKGYYNVASPTVRKAIEKDASQEAVWNAVAEVRKANKIEHRTKTYAALDNDDKNELTQKRDAYQQYFAAQLKNRADVVGMVVCSGDQVLGVEIFRTPTLFQSRCEPLLHGYIADAAVMEKTDKSLADAAIQARFERVARLTDADKIPGSETGKFSLHGQWLHVYSK
jgi:hypothetical protein